jgi:hypothetical protein
MRVSSAVFLAVLSLTLAYGEVLLHLVRWIFNLGRTTARRGAPSVDDVTLRLLRVGYVHARPTVRRLPRHWYDARPHRL